MKIAYCRTCKTVIAAGAIAPQQVVVVRGQRRVLNTMPWHRTEKGVEHRDVGLLDVPDMDPSYPMRAFKELTKEFKSKFS